jgi:hypothetical protein
MAGTAQHFLPATYLAGFSSDATVPRRKRRLTQGDKITGKSHTATVDRLAVINNFYTLRESYQTGPSAIDDSWGAYEARLAACIKSLVAGTINGIDWAGVLVPFVASLFARGPDFDARLNARAAQFGVSSLELKLSADNTTLARAMEIQRLLAPILAAKWIVSRSPEQNAFITTDLAFGIFQDPDDQVGIAIPLDGQHVLQLLPRRYGEVAIAGQNKKWYPRIEHRTLEVGNYRQQNQVLASTARRFIFGRSVSEIDSYLKDAKRDASLIELGDIGFVCGPLAAVHEFAWHRFISAVTQPINGEELSFDINWSAVAKIWKPPVSLGPAR